MFLKPSLIVSAVFSCSLVAAFDAGHIPKGSWLTGHGFRHGDIDDALQSFTNSSKTWKFNAVDVDRVYFGNWLRDYSQLVDVKSLIIFNNDILVTIVQVIGYINFGYGQAKYTITRDILGTYLPVQHIDNPSGYADGIDARKYDHRLRGPVNPMELNVDARTGMKNYIANDSGGWNTSTLYIRRALENAISMGRLAFQTGSDDMKYHAYRELGGALHTLEDFLAHSNWLELALIQMGYGEVFPFVGNQTQIRAPSGRMVYPLVTGTFSGSDMTYSLLGEVADYLSQASIRAIKNKVNRETARLHASNVTKTYGFQNVGKLSTIQSMLDSMTLYAQLRAVTAAASRSTRDSKHSKRILFEKIDRYDRTADNVKRDMGALQSLIGTLHTAQSQNGQTDPELLHQAISNLITVGDKVEATILAGFKDVIDEVAKIQGGLKDLRDNISLFISEQLEPLMTPLISLVTKEIYELMEHVLITTTDQWEVFNDTLSTNPTHSILSKDHFSTILNEPAGRVAQLVTSSTFAEVLGLWTDGLIDPEPIISNILTSIFHPEFVQPVSRTPIQARMLAMVDEWLSDMDPLTRRETIARLDKDSIGNFQNVRFQLADGQDKAEVKAAAGQAVEFWKHRHGKGDDGHLGLDHSGDAGQEAINTTQRRHFHAHGHSQKIDKSSLTPFLT